MSGLADILKPKQAELLVGVAPAAISFYKAIKAGMTFDEQDKFEEDDKVDSITQNHSSEETALYAVYTPFSLQVAPLVYGNFPKK